MRALTSRNVTRGFMPGFITSKNIFIPLMFTYYFAEIGAFLLRPQATKNAIPAMRIVGIIPFDSPIETLIAAASIITTAKPKAAAEVNHGMILNKEGRIKPNPPRISAKPAKYITPSEVCLAHSMEALCASKGVKNLDAPAIKNIKASKICKTQRPICKALDGEVVLDDIL